MMNKNFVINESNVEQFANKIATQIKDFIEKSGAKGVVLGMSGGIDCSVVARLCQLAGVNTHLVLMPYGDSMNKSKSKNNAMELINTFNFNYHTFDIKPAVDALSITTDSTAPNVSLAKANIRPRVRMTYLYQYAQINNLLVIGTGNLAERTVGYFTKWGDGASDLNPNGMLTKREIYILARYLNICESIIKEKPSAELWEGQNDEDELGVTYDQIDDFILNGTSGNKKADAIIKSKFDFAQHKLNPIPIFNN